ncbi:hypothetical protein A1507_20510 [Methylomonas koyamae]|uniref:Iron dicitrate transport regulator FecR n=2 Tax=Methylomonas koyamae TaxID=702114 RepID=A0A177N0J3_9GAMM|nr:hypothetical protein A1507_20510 [Methylomonas koyamae]
MLSMTQSPDDHAARIRSEASAWLARLRSGDCTPDDTEHFNAWLAAAPQHREAYRRAERLWADLAALSRVAQPQLRQAQCFYARSRAKRRWRAAGLAAAAMLAGILALNPAIWPWLNAEPYQTAKGIRRTVLLSDGTSIELNTDTALRVSYSGQRRTVWLERGEAWFNVFHDSDRPFEVVAGDGRIRDIGTQFNVRRDLDQVSVAVRDGEVAVFAKSQSAPLHVNAGQQTRYGEAGGAEPVQTSDLMAISAWRNGILLVKNRTLAEVAEELERYHPVAIDVTDAKLRGLAVSGRFPANDLELTLKTIATALPVQVVAVDRDHIAIRPNR